jgi:hypothetical protein
MSIEPNRSRSFTTKPHQLATDRNFEFCLTALAPNSMQILLAVVEVVLAIAIWTFTNRKTVLHVSLGHSLQSSGTQTNLDLMLVGLVFYKSMITSNARLLLIDLSYHLLRYLWTDVMIPP